MFTRVCTCASEAAFSAFAQDKEYLPRVARIRSRDLFFVAFLVIRLLQFFSPSHFCYVSLSIPFLITLAGTHHHPTKKTADRVFGIRISPVRTLSADRKASVYAASSWSYPLVRKQYPVSLIQNVQKNVFLLASGLITLASVSLASQIINMSVGEVTVNFFAHASCFLTLFRKKK